jgi:hypothetical protein
MAMKHRRPDDPNAGPGGGIAVVPVAVVPSAVEAELIAGMLRDHGVNAAVSADDAGGQEPELQVQGVRVLVASADEATARQLIAADNTPSADTPAADTPAEAGRPGAFTRWLTGLRHRKELRRSRCHRRRSR